MNRVDSLRLALRASRTTLGVLKYRMLLLVITIFFAVSSVAIPVLLVPGNSLAFQFGVMDVSEYVLLIVLSGFSALLVTMQIYAHFNATGKGRLSTAGQGSVSLVTSLFGGVSVASCGCSIGILFGLAGLGGGGLFIAEHKTSLIFFTIIIVLIGIHLTARRVMGVCTSCQIEV